MKLLAAAFALAIMVIGAVGLGSPSLLLALVSPLLAPGALYAVAAVRVLYGALLIAVAPMSRMRRTLRVLGGAIIAAGLLTPLLGVERLAALVAWWAGQPPWFMRAWAALGVAFGAFVLYALGPGRRAGSASGRTAR